MDEDVQLLYPLFSLNALSLSLSVAVFHGKNLTFPEMTTTNDTDTETETTMEKSFPRGRKAESEKESHGVGDLRKSTWRIIPLFYPWRPFAILEVEHTLGDLRSP